MDLRTLSLAQEEILRKQVMAAVLRGGIADWAAAAHFEVSTKSIGAWRARWETGVHKGVYRK
ncbi:hypothetical protein [Glycomyces tritici]|uniref:Helix-turn-helix domain-containing protein n=1 Tax=Glycomyces tritici TaxID=2665176 RepID=A0ABT7YHJ2_9ACTN|nr:hypothetical protein [Glycomyces tritici]MDN3238100.1 hypothetical protein [Glycomyces tritici]